MTMTLHEPLVSPPDPVAIAKKKEEEKAAKQKQLEKQKLEEAKSKVAESSSVKTVWSLGIATVLWLHVF